MNKLTCEMFNSNDIVKEGDFYVCQSCGTKYTAETAKQMMFGGSVDVTGSTVKVDQSDELKNLYILARNARNDNNSEYAQKYYEQILLKDVNSWEATFYTVYYQSMNCKIAEIRNAAIRMSNCEYTVLQLVRDNVTDVEERRKTLEEIAGRLIDITNMLYGAAKDHYEGLATSIRSRYTQEMLNNCCAAKDICCNFGDYIIQFFGDNYGKDIAVRGWKTGVILHCGLMSWLAYKEANREVIASYVSKIQKFDSSYQMPAVKNSSGGCYVATAIYGSYDCPQVWTLRRFRDYTLAETWYGRAFIKTYYAISPTLVKWFGKTEWFKNLWKPKLDRMVRKLNSKGVKDTPYSDRNR